jgi:hypothetical protein
VPPADAHGRRPGARQPGGGAPGRPPLLTPWTGVTPGATPITPLDQRLADPDGEEFDLVGTLALSGIASLGSF